ncbi:hypothetical protein NEUTE2DRAFT_134832 [Neurospora tetrasperma FGSC 2509]|nr:hypothetical protein NEUTE2DRAFT_134832 [Neurospora tetrasperma FGSC 2509]
MSELVCPKGLKCPDFGSGIQWWERGREYGAVSTNYSTFASATSRETGSVHRGEGGLDEGSKVFEWNVPATPGNGMGRYYQTKCHVQIRGAGQQSTAIYLVECQSPFRAWHMTSVGRSSVASFYQGQDQEGREGRHAIASQGWRLRRTRICGINMIFLASSATMCTSKASHASHASQVCIPDLASRGVSRVRLRKLNGAGSTWDFKGDPFRLTPDAFQKSKEDHDGSEVLNKQDTRQVPITYLSATG